MARRAYRQKRYSRRNKWCPNIQELLSTNFIPTAEGTNFGSFTLAFNPLQNNSAVSQIYTVKNFDISFIAETQITEATKLEDVSVYIMFRPQGMNISENYNLEHPEYIMAHKFLGSPSVDGSMYGNTTGSGQQYQPFKVRTRLSRRLNTGDSIILFIKYNYQSASSAANALTISGVARWWTKAN